MKLSKLSIAIALTSTVFNPFYSYNAHSNTLMQAKHFDQANFLDSPTLKTREDITDYLVSEKLDGIRAYWNGKTLLTRSGKTIHAPSWFTGPLPNTALDGELWVSRGKFQQVAQTVLDNKPNDDEWRSIKFMIFDLPSNSAPFEHRYQQLLNDINLTQIAHVSIVQQKIVTDITALEMQLKLLDESNGEGLMLHHRHNGYYPGRSDQLLKLKSYQDAEATVIGYTEGNGKFDNKMGALWVVTPDDITFKIGSGFKDFDRENPPAVGTTILFRYNGVTNSGIPRFARFIRIRDDLDI
ncbi:DNA ligase [Photobacterium profundum]|uniref:Uncharacterized protein n=1 Tax=Photobacterium profundum (strain SS9) TaxID=298386 RepID=Q6LIB5_PHOPR|nr:DNA ligase [Photobacterium profundum]CAG22965.1 hypothetical protein PBPRB1093 [Photobacterium profundum SS9]